MPQPPYRLETDSPDDGPPIHRTGTMTSKRPTPGFPISTSPTTTSTATPVSATGAVLPNNKLATPFGQTSGPKITGSTPTTRSYAAAVITCTAKVAKIAAECRVANRKYRDFDFDLRADGRYCLDGLTEGLKSDLTVEGVARVGDVFEKPKFFKDGATAGDIQQGATGDCWFLAALATITNVPTLVEKICVARDELVGVYGFIFMRDGEWFPVIVDDQLYLSRPEYHDAASTVRQQFHGKEKEYNTTFARGSEALKFAKCEDQDETWLPLLEKAYAKAHGDYGAIEGGWTGEAVEDLTGGVTSEVFTCDILDKERFWKEELSLANRDFLFAAGLSSGTAAERSGIISGHAYSVLKAKEVKGQRFVLVRNPWGFNEWTGPWSDGSKEWTAEWMVLLDHRFGDDGAFWMSYHDFLHKFSQVDRTRLFDSTWTVISRWVKVPVPWMSEYSATRFELTVTRKTHVVLVLSQLDGRYFRGLEGEYEFALHFCVRRAGETDYLIRSRSNVGMSRSVNAEVELPAGKYLVVFKITAEKDSTRHSVAQVVGETSRSNRRKFLQIGRAYDHAREKASVLPEDAKKIDEAEARVRKARVRVKAEMAEKDREKGAGKGAGKSVGRGKKAPTKAPTARTRISWRRQTTRGFREGDADVDDEDGDADVDADGDADADDEDYEHSEPPTDTEDSPDTAADVWNAVAYIGLRVYAQDKDLTIEVLHDDREGGNKDALDPDDPAKDLEEVEDRMAEEEDVD